MRRSRLSPRAVVATASNIISQTATFARVRPRPTVETLRRPPDFSRKRLGQPAAGRQPFCGRPWTWSETWRGCTASSPSPTVGPLYLSRHHQSRRWRKVSGPSAPRPKRHEPRKGACCSHRDLQVCSIAAPDTRLISHMLMQLGVHFAAG